MPNAEEQAPTKQAPATASPRPKLVQLPGGDEVSGEATAPFTRGALARVIVLAGPFGSGKTSLLAAIYDLFGRGPVGGYTFAGSETFRAFERRCHPSRIASERAEAAAGRTTLDWDPKLLHLRLRSSEGVLTNILMTDPSGEVFRVARDSTDDCRKLSIVKRADVLALCLDGDGLAKRRTRAAIIADGRTLLRSMLDSGMLGQSSHVQVLFTKADKLAAAEDQPEATLLAGIEADFRTHFESRLMRLDFLKTSVVPLSSAVGIEGLLQTWTERLPIPPASLPGPTRDGSRRYDRFDGATRHGE